jgi:hypothetical protein
MSEKEWRIVSNPKFLACDQHGFSCKADFKFNSFLGHLPWWALDRPLSHDCLLYQVDSNGALHLLQMINVYKIQTRLGGYTLLYKHDVRHAQLHLYTVPKARLFHIGLMSVKSSFQTSTDPVLS